MTSNVGTRTGSGIGFAETSAAGASAGDVQRALRETFRPEFINRIDRIVVFRPLGRGIMRALLDKEIREVLGRRGLRNRPWAIEWEESAIELLIRHGFSPLLGARPRIERIHLEPVGCPFRVDLTVDVPTRGLISRIRQAIDDGERDDKAIGS